MEIFGIVWSTSDPAVQSALISATQNVITTIVASVGAALLSRKLLSRRRLEEKLSVAHRDIVFLLVVERLHCDERRATGSASLKLTMRDRAREEGHQWSGRFTASRAGSLKTGIADTGLNSR